MQVVYRRCCGMDVHKDSITACVLVFNDKGEKKARRKEFGTRELLDDLERVEKKRNEIEEEIEQRLQPQQALMERLTTMPGVDGVTAWTLLAELGTDRSIFPDADHAASWAGLVPANHESGGKRHNARTRKGNRWLRRALCQTAWAVAHQIPIIAYHLIALLQRALARGRTFQVPSGVLGQAWRNGRVQAILARFLRGEEVKIVPLDAQLARACGELCGATNTADIIDASVVILARARRDTIVTSDPDDPRRLDPSAAILVV
ncbi:MAG TPA: transposase [Bryobacteraceae bacterium]|nr:transposase [Bryobacteraceae bacterium]